MRRSPRDAPHTASRRLRRPRTRGSARQHLETLIRSCLERVNALSRWKSRCAPSENEHTDLGPEHEKGNDAHRHAAEHGTRLLFHQLAARSDEENSDEEKRGQQPIYDRGPVESLERTDLREVQRDTGRSRDPDNEVEAARSRHLLIEPDRKSTRLNSSHAN